MIASCGYFEEKLRECSKEEGVTMADSVETLGVDLRSRVKKLGAKEKTRRRKCKAGFSLTKRNKAFQKSYMKVVFGKLPRAGMLPARTWRRIQWRWPLQKVFSTGEANGSSSSG